MAYTFRTATTQGNASGAGLTVTKPTGTLDGDLLVVVGYLETDTNTWSSVGAGFTALRRDVNSAGFCVQVWWKITASEPASWTWTPNVTGWRTVEVAAYSGATATGGNQVDVEGLVGNSNASINVVVPGVTTTATNDMGVVICGNIQGVVSSEVGFATNERADFGGVIIADAQQAAIGGTGTTTVGAGTADYNGRTIGFLLSAVGGGASIPPGLGPVVGMQEPQHFDNALMR